MHLALLRPALVPALLALLLGACGPAAPSSPPPAAPAGGASAPSGTAASPSSDWEQQWNALKAAAQQEGTVVVLGPPTPDLRRRLPEAFQQRFGITVEYTGQASGDYAARLASERSAGIYSADVVISGSNSMYEVLAGRGEIQNGAMGMLAPLRHALILPEVLDTSKYRFGKLIFMDPAEQYVYRMNNTVNRTITLNTDYVRPSDIRSWNDLLKPEYRGRISTYDPTVAGAATNQSAALYKNLGADYVRRLYVDQEPFVTRDHRQTADLLARGTYPIALSLQQQEVGRLADEGFSVRPIKNPPESPDSVSAGFGHLGLLDRAPHPNAAKLFVNWLLTREGQQIWENAQRQVSVRNDLDDSALPAEWVPQPGEDYFDENAWDFTLEVQPKIREDIRAMMGR
ncbi:MAG TPA: extracellular solute-binding protein [Chloroflexota bacterium]|nr:extracellular solute-binding protein [Chloroflexota bacterium]